MSTRGMQPYFTVQQRNSILDRQPDYSGKRYYGKYRGIVVDNDDPDLSGQLLVRVPAIHGDYDCGWALPCFPFVGDNYGVFWVPEKGDAIWVEFEQGIPDYPIWVGGWNSPSNAINETGSYSSKQHIFQTKGGLRIILDDGSNGTQYIEVKDNNGNYIQIDSTNNNIVISSTGKISFGSGSKSVARDGDTVQISGTDSHGDSFSATGVIQASSNLLFSD